MKCRLMVVVSLVVAGCKKPEGPSRPPPSPVVSAPVVSEPPAGGPIVATFADHRITAGELQRYFDEQSRFVQSHYGDLDGKKAILGIMIKTQLLSDEALREGFDLDDEAVEQYRKAIITHWKRAKFNAYESQHDVSDADLRAYYDGHRIQYQRRGLSFEDAKPEIRDELWDERRGQMYEASVKNLIEQAQIKIDDNELAKVNRGTSEEPPQPGSAVPRTPLDAQLHTTLPPYRESAADKTGPIVATFAGHQIPTAELQRYFDEQAPGIRAHFHSEEAKKKLLTDLIKAQILVDEGLKGGFDQNQLVLDKFRKSMITQWMESNFDEVKGQRSLSEADLRAYWDAHRDDYRLPAKVRVGMIFFKATPGREAAVQAEAEQDRQTLIQSKERIAFPRLAVARSDDADSKKRQGDLDLRTHQELAKSYGEAVASAADALVAPGDLSPVVRGTGGFYLLQLDERTRAYDPTFESSEPQLRFQLWSERRNKLFDDRLNQMMQEARIKIDETELAKLELNAGQPSNQATPAVSMPQTGWEKHLRTPLTASPKFPYTAQTNLGSL